jgi:DNA-binding NarL/FixJ family response regulator
VRVKPRILLVDDHPLMREGLRQLLETEPGVEVCGEAETLDDALAAVERLQPDVVVLDLTLGADDGVELVRVVRQRFPKVRILVLSMHEESLYAERLLTLGAHGYVMKHESATTFLQALRKIIAGEIYVSPSLGNRLYGKLARNRDAPRPGGGLTAREREVLVAISQGKGTQEIANMLSMSAKTVDSHRRNIREKLGLASATDLVRYAVRWARETDVHHPEP